MAGPLAFAMHWTNAAKAPNKFPVLLGGSLRRIHTTVNLAFVFPSHPRL